MSSQSKTAEELKGHAEDAVDTVSNMAKDAAGTAKAKVAAKSEAAKDGLASEMHDTAAALRRAADEVRDGSPQGSTFSMLANGLADMADSVQGQNVSDIASVASNFARKNPVAFLGGAALLGFAVSRFAKASEAPQHGGHSASGTAMQSPRGSAHSTAYNPNIPTMETDNG
ncbi:hypothetical protein [Sulfitobacter sp. S190]|uniref:hypothetical protein n=1 Tax=Sulfitobacter sp. S190 TaxID=2867022 RepID=UPI0021A80BB2|nr:hypothetical protein [Sulfitobacter sp. S190]UWR21744.1 hypothetical protein K3756_13760 [Sulfitobacter sp. S190]